MDLCRSKFYERTFILSGEVCFKKSVPEFMQVIMMAVCANEHVTVFSSERA